MQPAFDSRAHAAALQSALAVSKQPSTSSSSATDTTNTANTTNAANAATTITAALSEADAQAARTAVLEGMVLGYVSNLTSHVTQKTAHAALISYVSVRCKLVFFVDYALYLPILNSHHSHVVVACLAVY